MHTVKVVTKAEVQAVYMKKKKKAPRHQVICTSRKENDTTKARDSSRVSYILVILLFFSCCIPIFIIYTGCLNIINVPDKEGSHVARQHDSVSMNAFLVVVVVLFPPFLLTIIKCSATR